MAGDVLLPGPDARIAPTTFDDWLAGETPSRRGRRTTFTGRRPRHHDQ
jgi:hypothetical protein